MYDDQKASKSAHDRESELLQAQVAHTANLFEVYLNTCKSCLSINCSNKQIFRLLNTVLRTHVCVVDHISCHTAVLLMLVSTTATGASNGRSS
jgi:hypothetical protein